METNILNDYRYYFDAIREFEKETGLLVSDIEYNKRTVFNCTETSVSIIISL